MGQFAKLRRKVPSKPFFGRWISVAFLRAGLALALMAALAASPAFGATGHRAPASAHATHHKHQGKSKAKRPHGQQAIEPSRVMEIQQALIREHYLTGEANGRWDEATKAAMAEVSGRPWLADETHARLPGPEEAWPGPRLLERDQRQELLVRSAASRRDDSAGAGGRFCGGGGGEPVEEYLARSERESWKAHAAFTSI